MLTLLGVAGLFGYPQITANPISTSTVQYSASTKHFDATDIAARLLVSASGPLLSISNSTTATPSRTSEVHILVNNDGSLNSGDSLRDDLLITGKVTINSVPYDGILLQGEIVTAPAGQGFGYTDPGDPVPGFDFRLSLTGGLLAPFFAGQDIGVSMVIESSNYNGSFGGNFAGVPKAVIGPIPPVTHGPPLIVISGTKFEDATGNGITDDDQPLSGVTINLFQESDATPGLDAGDTLVTSTLTAADGSYTFGGLAAGTYYVQEDVGSDYVQTSSPDYYTFVIPADSDFVSTGNDFANFKKITISGTKYTDITGNSFSDDDTPRAGVTVNLYLDGDHSTPIASTTTGADGSYSFPNLGPETYFVQEVVPGDSTQTGGTSGYTIEAKSGLDSTGNDFDNFTNITITGTKYTDITGNSFSGDDTPLAGVAVNLYLDSDHSNIIASTTTGADGSYSFPNLGPGTYFVQEVLPTGYVQTGGNAGYTVTATSGTNSTGNDFDNFQKMSISGTKYIDRTGDGITLADDTPLGGVVIDLFKDGGATPFLTTTTGPDGTYSFTDLEPATYVVKEELPGGYYQTVGVSGYTITPVSGLASIGNDFANFQKISISGTKYNDVNGDGKTEGDQGLQGITINLYDASGFVTSTTTDANGNYSFNDLGPGTYTVQEVLPDGSVQTLGAGGYIVAAESGHNVPGENFANFKLISISGTKYNDLNGDGSTAGDSGLGGITIDLLRDGIKVDSTSTADDGTYSFNNLGPGTYTVVEELPDGSFQTLGAGGYVIDATSGTNSTGNNFANFELIDISGRKYDDLNGDGSTDGDPGLDGITINLYNGTSLVASTVTNNGGYYSFLDLQPGTYTVQEVVPGGSVQTLGAGGYIIPAVSGQDSAGNDFANFKKITISGTKYTDLTGNSFSADDTPLAGITVNLYLDSDHTTAIATTTTDDQGNYAFPNLGPGTYYVQEVVPSGYKQTGGNAGYTIAVTSGIDSTGNNFDNYLKKPGIDIEKTTTGSPNANPTPADYDNEDAPDGPGVPILTPGTAVTWTYKVTNTGDISFPQAQVVVTDDSGTPGNAADDLSTTNGKITFLSEQTGNGDNVLDPGEVWLYKATGIVQTLTTATGSSASFDFSGNSALNGSAGNIRTFTANGVSVKASAFSRDSSGNWATAYLGSYGGGLGVTDTSEDGTNNTHTVDNSGRNNYVLLEFSENIVANSAFLGYVVNDSDMKIWIGTMTDPFTNHIALNDAVLSSLGFTEVNAGSSSTRTASFNAGGVSGNVIVIAADPGDLQKNDYFKVQSLTFKKTQTGIYENKGSVTVPGASDSDLSHYKNGTPPPTGAIDIEKYVKPTDTPCPTGGEGLTPGFWKQSQHFYAWSGPYANGQYLKYDTIFGLTSSQDDPNLTLLGALGRGGGGKNALGRHAVAAILNAANPNIDYAYTISAIITMVRGAYASGDYETTKNLLATENEKEADLSNTACNCTTPTTGYGDDADTAPGISVTAGTSLTFTYVVTNPGPSPIVNVVVTDDNETPGNTADDFHPTPSLDGGFNVGDDDQNGMLDVGELWIYTATRTALSGVHTNIGSVTGNPVDSAGHQGPEVTDSDAANYNAPAASVTISGTKVLDKTGNGLTADDTTGIAGVTIRLYKDAGTIGKLDGESVFMTTTTATDGSYSFTNLPIGHYLVQEVVPDGYVRTYPTFNDYQAVDAKSNMVYGGNNFANAEACCQSEIANISYTITHINGKVENVSDLRGHVDQGDRVKVTFTSTGSAAHTYSLVSYTAPGSTFDANTAYKQQIFDSKSVSTGTGTGTFSLEVVIPDCYFQVDFVCGLPIDTFGPAGSNIFYTPQNRLFSADNDGTNACCSVSNASLSGFVYWDANDNGIFDTNESPIPGTTVKLYNSSNVLVGNTTTGADGSYLFTGLPAGTYRIVESQPSGWTDGKDTIGTPGGDSSVNDTFSSIVLPANFHGINNNFGEKKAAASSSLSGYVFQDCDNDGVKESGEAGIGNVTVKLFASNGTTLLATTTTDSYGKYTFSNLAPGTYVIKETQPTPFLDGKDKIGSLGGTTGNDIFSDIIVGAGQSGINYNFGEIKSSKLCGYVYKDRNNNGCKDWWDSGIGGVCVTLTGTDDLGKSVCLTTKTDCNGYYSFDNLRPGKYKITESDPTAYFDGKDSVGTCGGSVSNDCFYNIVLGSDAEGSNYCFGER